MGGWVVGWWNGGGGGWGAFTSCSTSVEYLCNTRRGQYGSRGGQGREGSNAVKTSCLTHPDLNWATRVKSAGRPVRPLRVGVDMCTVWWRRQHTCTKEGPREEPRWLAMHHSPAFCCETGRGRHASSIPTPSSSMWERTQGEADMSTAAFVGKAGGLISCAHHEQLSTGENGDRTVDLWVLPPPQPSSRRGSTSI